MRCVFEACRSTTFIVTLTLLCNDLGGAYLELNYTRVWNSTGELLLFREEFEGALGRWSGTQAQTLERDNSTQASGRFSGKLVGSNGRHREGFFSYLCPYRMCHHRPVRLSFYMRSSHPELSGPYVTLTEILNRTGHQPAIPVFASNHRVFYSFVDEDGNRFTSAGVPFERDVWYRIDVTIDWNKPMSGVKLFVNNALAECNLPLRNGASTLSVGRVDAYNFDAPYSWLDDLRVYLREEGNHWTAGFCVPRWQLVPPVNATDQTFGTFLYPPGTSWNGTEPRPYNLTKFNNTIVLSTACDPPCRPGALCLPTNDTGECPAPNAIDGEQAAVKKGEELNPLQAVAVLVFCLLLSLTATIVMMFYLRWSRRRDAALAAARAVLAAAAPPAGVPVPLLPPASPGRGSPLAGMAGGLDDMP